MLVSLAGAFNPWSVVIECAWILFSVVGLVRWYFLTSGLRLTAGERALVDTAFPGLEPYLARRVLAAGVWRDLPVDEVLTREDEVVDALVYLASGQGSVRVGGREVGRCGPGTLVGELGVASGKPAIATVTISEPAQVFTVPSGSLRQLMTRNRDIRIALEAGIGASVRSKFIAANTRAAAGWVDLATPV
jgi:CRP-like cAMP-binding protein